MSSFARSSPLCALHMGHIQRTTIAQTEENTLAVAVHRGEGEHEQHLKVITTLCSASGSHPPHDHCSDRGEHSGSGSALMRGGT